MEVHVRGPLFDGRANAAVDAAAEDIEATVAERGLVMIRDMGWRTYKHPTGNYARHLEVRREPPGVKVWDNNIVYGPWLEGTGSRNRTTRFKGYGLWRKMRTELEAEAGTVADLVVHRYVGRMN